MIGRILDRGRQLGGLLYYLYGPGKACEHVNPHLVSGLAAPGRARAAAAPGRAPGLPQADRAAAAAGGAARRPCPGHAGVALRGPRRAR